MNLIELSNILKVDKATTTKAIQKLMRQGYVLRERNSDDKRMWHLFPSPKAKEVYDYIIQEENANIESCFAGFNAEEKDIVYRLVKRMRESIERDWEDLK